MSKVLHVRFFRVSGFRILTNFEKVDRSFVLGSLHNFNNYNSYFSNAKRVCNLFCQVFLCRAGEPEPVGAGCFWLLRARAA